MLAWTDPLKVAVTAVAPLTVMAQVVPVHAPDQPANVL
jgi:hypothetical protein